ncbi:BREX-3 system P-loop-containing protein BrxF [uncultured Thiodictyon sp.]|uniref:BREX-3 system P-loop-containing protein BrxF n=1 Tax=uncultured Thiodictyon sp. TaxID=1846217 RepID=UPI0025E36695|nr:BREX-3 system P-loop-containing protein BrxF [uncultured Thiodictyon sp.]
MLARLQRLVDDLAALHSQLILLVGPPGSGKTALLRAFGGHAGAEPLNLGAELGRRLTAVPHRERQLQVGSLLREIAKPHACGNLLLIDNIELLFDASLALNPLDLLKRQAQAWRVVAVWPAALRHSGNGPRLTYAEMGHTEYRDYGLDGVVTLDIK